MVTRLYTLIALILSLCCHSDLSWAQKNPHSIRQAVEAVRQSIVEKGKGLESKLKNMNGQQQELATLEQKISAHEAQTSDLEKKLKALNKELSTLQQEQDRLVQAHHQAYTSLATQMTQQLKTQKAPAALFFQPQRQAADWPRLSKCYAIIHLYRQSLITEFANQVQHIQDAQQKIEDKHQALSQTLAHFSALNHTLSQEKATRYALVAHLQKEIATDESHLAKLKKDEAALNQVLAQLLSQQVQTPSRPALPLNKASKTPKQPPPFKHFSYPVAKALFSLQHTSYFPKTRYANFVPLATQTPIQAISNGRVIFSNWLRGLGLLVIVDHGQGYMSLYGNNERLLKNTGEQVSAGETIAYSGQTGGIPKPGLYFEVRRKGQLLDPGQWF